MRTAARDTDPIAAAEPARAGHEPAKPPITMLLSLRRFSPTVYTPRYVATPRAMKPEVRGLSRNHARTRPVAMRAALNPSTFCGGRGPPLGGARGGGRGPWGATGPAT